MKNTHFDQPTEQRDIEEKWNFTGHRQLFYMKTTAWEQTPKLPLTLFARSLDPNAIINTLPSRGIVCTGCI